MAGERVILVDSDVLIAHLRGVPAALEWLLAARRRDQLAVSVITITEVTGGMRSAERREVWALLDTFRVQPVTEVIARQAGEYMRSFRRSHSGIGLGDYLIAATANTTGLELATLNVRHFPMFAELRPAFHVEFLAELKQYADE